MLKYSKTKRPKRFFIGLIAVFLLVSSFTSIALPLFTKPVYAEGSYSYNDILQRAQAWSILNQFVKYAKAPNGSKLLPWQDDYILDNSSSDVQTCDIFGGSDDGDIMLGAYVTGSYGYNSAKAGAQVDYGSWENVYKAPGLTNVNAALAAAGIQGGCLGLMQAAGFKSPFKDNDKVDRSKIQSNLQAAIDDSGHSNFFLGAKLGDPSPGTVIEYVILRQMIGEGCGWSYKGPFDPNGTTPEAIDAKSNGYNVQRDNAYYHTYTADGGGSQDNIFLKSNAAYTSTTNFGFSASKPDAYIGPTDNLKDIKTNSTYKTVSCEGGGSDTFGGNLQNQKFSTDFANVVPNVEDQGASDESGAAKSTCNVSGGFGWVICPVSNFLSTMVDAMWGFIEGQLTIKPALFDTSSTAGTYTAWKIFRDYANIAFIIAFLFIVYSQITSIGVSNYGIKKMLPKIVIAAILVNVSYFICQFAVDLSNLLGHSIDNLFKGIAGTIDASSAANTGVSSTLGQNGGLAAIITGVLISGLILLVALALGLLGPILIAVAMVFIILLLRQVFVVVLIVISPLAFVAYLLPNTEKWFKKWWDTFVKVLMVFPIVALVIGGSSIAASIISAAAISSPSKECSQSTSTTITPECTEQQNGLTQIISVAVLTLPFFVIPGLLKKSMEASGALGAKLSGLSDRANKRIGSKASKSGYMQGRKMRQQEKERFKSQKLAGRMANGNKWNPRAVVARGGLPITPAGRKARKSQVASAQAVVSKATEEAVKAEEVKISGKSADELTDHLGEGSVEEQAAAIRRIVAVGGDGHIQKAFDHLMTSKDPKTKDVQQLVSGALGSRKPAGMSGRDMGALQTGTLSGTGYKAALLGKVQEQKFGAKDYAGMTADDLARLAELSEEGSLSDDDLQHVHDQYTAITNDETLKGTMTGEREVLFENIILRQKPLKADRSTARATVPLSPTHP